jgi:hypothetical protein
MDRQTIYFGQIPLETDLLHAQQNALVALAKLSSGVLGTPTAVNGFTCTPTNPASLNVVLTAGEIYQLENLEATAWSSLPANTAYSIVKQGVQLGNQIFGITPPATFGYSQVFLLEVQYQDLDSGALVLPYYNAANPSQPFAGPGNAGSAQNTVRQGAVAAQIKAGVAAPTGSQIAPTQDPGWTGLFYITVANGATTITAGNIVQITTAPFIPVTLPGVPPGVQSGIWIYAVDLGAQNAMVANVWPVPTQLTVGMEIRVKAAFGNTGPATLNLNGLGTVPIHRANGAVLSSGDYNAGQVLTLCYDGAAWQIVNYFGFTSSTTNNNTYNLTIPYVADSSTTPNVITANFTPPIASLAVGMNPITVKLANTVTGATTIAVNTNAAVPVVNQYGQPLSANDCVAGEILLMLFTGTQFQLIGGEQRIERKVVYNTHGVYTWTVPVGVYEVDVELWGAGAGGMNTNIGPTSGTPGGTDATGGTSGGYARKTCQVTPGQQITVTVGQGGAAWTAASTGANAGSSTSFGAFFSATGGSWTNFTGYVNVNLGTPGNGVGGDINIMGGFGWMCQVQTDVQGWDGEYGFGASAPNGGGIAGPYQPGAWPGGGGGGGDFYGPAASEPSGAGADGGVIIRW